MEPTRSRRRTRLWYAHILIVVAVEFATESARGLVLPTLFSYSEHLGGDLAFVVLLTALFSAGRFASSLILGALSDRISFKTLYLISGAAAVAGNALYVLPYSRHVHSKVLLGVSRFLVGFGAGNRSVCRANIAALTRIDQRISYFTLLAAVVFLAYALTPGLGGVFGDIDVTVFGSEYIHFNRFTAPGFLLVALNLATLAFVGVVYDDSVKRYDAPKPTNPVSSKIGGREREPSTELGSPPPNRDVLGGVLVFLFLNFNARGMLSVFETVNVPLYAETVNGTLSGRVAVFDLRTTFLPATRPIPLAADASDVIAGASHFYLMVGLLGLITYGGVHKYGNRISDTNLLLFGFTTLLTGNGLLVALSRLFMTGSRDSTMKLRLFVGAEILVWSVGSPIASAVIVPAFSKLLGTRKQGTLMGVFGATASIARMSMPLLPSALSSWELLFCVNLGLCASSMFALVAYRVTHVSN